MKKIKTLQAAFNMLDPFQRELYEYASGVCPNSSGYIKRLIQREKEGIACQPRTVMPQDDNSELMGMMI